MDIRTILTLDDMRALIPKMPDREGFSSSLYLCKSGPLAGQFAADVLCEPAIDTAAMSVRMRISTPQLDRVNHVVKHGGILTDFYKDNPVVLFGHGMEGIVFPVAMSEDRQGNLTVQTCDDGTYATAFHSKDLKFSSQMFDLVVQKFIRASSIGITPTVCSKGYDSEGSEVLFIDEGQLNEWSYCTIGINPGARIAKSIANYNEFLDLQCDAANRILTASRLDGTSIHPCIRKSLQAAVITKATTPGIDTVTKPEEERPMQKKTLTLKQIKQMKPKQLAKSFMDFDEYDDETRTMLKAAMELMDEDEDWGDDTPAAGPEEAEGGDFPEEVGDVVEEMPEEFGSEITDSSSWDQDETPLGSRVLRAVHEGLNGLVATSSASMKPVENPDVRQAGEDVINQLKDIATSIEGIFSEKYPDQPGLTPNLDDPTEDMVKSFLATASRGRDQIRGLAARLDVVAKAAAKDKGKITEQHLKLIKATSSDLLRINQQAKSFKPKAAPAAKPAAATPAATEDIVYKEAFDELKKQFTSLTEALGQFPMPMPKSDQ
jgi:hypothetical protein